MHSHDTKFHSVASEMEYQLMQTTVAYELQKQVELLKKNGKKSSQPGATPKPLAISIQDMCPASEKKSIAHTNKKSAKSPLGHRLKADVEDSEAPTLMHQYFDQLQNKYGKCNKHRNKLCLILRDGTHYFLTIEQLRLWAMSMELGAADLNSPPKVLNVPLANHPTHHAPSVTRQPSSSMVIRSPVAQLSSDVPPIQSISGSLLHSVISMHTQSRPDFRTSSFPTSGVLPYRCLFRYSPSVLATHLLVPPMPPPLLLPSPPLSLSTPILTSDRTLPLSPPSYYSSSYSSAPPSQHLHPSVILLRFSHPLQYSPSDLTTLLSATPSLFPLSSLFPLVLFR
ncbi:uncharacterized protein EI90DRAFT_3128666 [Cantharellus anzutake]|uniref:uncharacterized protein n=1 Tax=Cantharellus anzutake TaxID=1750568 RepID=UPI0019042EED|nr:uncharacterized protein EI90DRAFT_3128666 [Cantharellus anzutake]KAF8325571.1 hypothetical protein EI90DRAFT_3128666 [Cantharellus anzutake]